ncbi:unnamed protein product [Owenia fusiformis]|uniref:Uncharacterized protein n=1 Tax=Owenia fusiformis TaxID=6347 RepID=A0A8J1UDA9_OWEFU|nr:unnamed protein product [Owenia fusiformis]
MRGGCFSLCLTDNTLSVSFRLISVSLLMLLINEVFSAGKQEQRCFLKDATMICRQGDINATSLPNYVPLNVSFLEVCASRDVVFSDVRVLKVSALGLPEIRLGDFHNFPGLFELDLSENKISIINDRAFRGLYNLRKLNLSGNNIDVLTDMTFRGLHQLTFLDISRNNLERIETGVFDSLVNMSVLNASNNIINQLTDKVFSRSSSISTLDLSYNELPPIIWRHLSLLLSLERLYITGNYINCNCLSTEKQWQFDNTNYPKGINLKNSSEDMIPIAQKTTGCGSFSSENIGFEVICNSWKRMAENMYRTISNNNTHKRRTLITMPKIQGRNDSNSNTKAVSSFSNTNFHYSDEITSPEYNPMMGIGTACVLSGMLLLFLLCLLYDSLKRRFYKYRHKKRLKKELKNKVINSTGVTIIASDYDNLDSVSVLDFSIPENTITPKIRCNGKYKHHYSDLVLYEKCPSKPPEEMKVTTLF